MGLIEELALSVGGGGGGGSGGGSRETAHPPLSMSTLLKESSRNCG